MTEFNVTAIRVDELDSDAITISKLTENAKKVYTALSLLTRISLKNTWKLNLSDFCTRNNISEVDFMAGVKELCNQNYFMYFIATENRYVFGTSRMVY